MKQDQSTDSILGTEIKAECVGGVGSEGKLEWTEGKLEWTEAKNTLIRSDHRKPVSKAFYFHG